MSEEPQLLFLADPKRFMEFVINDDSKVRFDGLIANVDDVVLCEIIRFGYYQSQEMTEPLARLYRELVLKIPEDRRVQIYEHIIGLVKNSSFVSINALLPFIAEDSSRGIVARAVIDYVSLGPLTNNDPMSRVKDIINMIESNMLGNEGAAFGALLHIGDKRVCQLLISLRDSLDDDAVNEAIKCSTGFIHAATVDFYLDWLEGMGGDDRDGAFGTVASGLALLKKKSRIDQVCTGHRPFPGRDVKPEQWKAMMKPISLAEYLKLVAPRMYALERSEPPPRIMPHVLAEWGLKPLTDTANTASLSDRAKISASSAGNEPIPGGRIVDVDQEWWDCECQIFLTWGILNPNGPTLYVLGSRMVDNNHRTFMRWLHMLGGCTTYAADTTDTITYQRILEDAISIHEHLVQKEGTGLFHVIPSFLIVNHNDDTVAHIAKRLLSNSAAGSADWGRHMAYVRQFGANFFGRAGAEIRECYETEMAKAKSTGQEPPDFIKLIELRYGHLPDFRDAKIPSAKRSALTPELLEEWWRSITPRDYNIQALLALKTMWKGASSQMPDENKASMVTWDSALGFLDNYRLALPNR